MAYDSHKNYAYSKVAVAPSPANSGTTLTITTGDGTKFPTTPFNATVYPANQQPLVSNSEIIRVTNVTSDTFTFTRLTNTEPNNATSARSIQVGDQIHAGPTVKTVIDLETNKVEKSGDTMTGLLQFSGSGHAGLKLNSLTTTQRDALTPSNGMMTYNSTTSQVQRYENGTWKTFASNGFVTVGFSDADYIVDGTADNVEIQAAVNAVSAAGGGIVFIKRGTYNLAATIDLGNNVILKGEGFVSKLVPTSGSSIVAVSNVTAGALRIPNLSKVMIKDIGIDGANLLQDGAGIFVTDSSDVIVDGCRLENMYGFGIFTSSGWVSSTGVCQRITLCNNYVQGKGHNDVLGGGKHVNTSTITDVNIYGNTVIQDTSSGSTYGTAIDLVGVSRFSYNNNIVTGSVAFGIEGFPNQLSSITNNIVQPAIGQSGCRIWVITNASSTDNNKNLVIANNNLKSNGFIEVTGISGFPVKNLSITGNVMDGDSSVSGIVLTYCSQGVITGNVVNGHASKVLLSNCDNFEIDGNVFIGGSYGVRDLTGVTTINIGKNTYVSMGIANTVNGNPSHSITIPSGTVSPQAGLLITNNSTPNSIQVNNSATPKFAVGSAGAVFSASYLRVGAVATPTNTTAGDLTATRVMIGTQQTLASALQLGGTGGTSADGITFGTDTNLYRSAADTLKTDDNLIVGSGRLGIGLSVPTALLSIRGNGTSTGGMRIDAGNIGQYFDIYHDGNNLLIENNGTTNASFRLSDTTRGDLMTLDVNSGSVSINSYSLTGSDTTQALRLAGTWNTTGAPTAIELDLTDTASDASSKLMNLKVGGGSQFAVTKSGRVGINQSSPSAQLDITKTSIGSTPADTNGLLLANTTAAAAGAQQYSPQIRWRGQGWKTNATAASQSLDVRAYLVTTQGAAFPSGYLVFENQLNNAGYSEMMRLNMFTSAMTLQGKIGLQGISPSYGVHVGGESAGSINTIATENPDNSEAGSSARFLAITDDDAGDTSLGGDPYIQLSVSGTTDWTIGIDNSDSDKLKIGPNAAVGTSTALTITTGGAVTLNTAGASLSLSGATSGTTALAASATASGTLTLPAATDTLVGRATTDTLTNKTLGATTMSGTLTFGANNIATLGNTAIDGTAARDITVARATSGNGQNLTITPGGGQSGGTNASGGNLILQSGTTTGSGTSAIVLQVPRAAGSGSSDNSNSGSSAILFSVSLGLPIFALSRSTISTTGLTVNANAYALSGSAAGALEMYRHGTANTAGSNMTIESGGATSSATDKASGDLILKTGISTGTGASKVRIQTYTVATSTGTSDNTAIDRVIVTSPKSVTNNSATTLLSFTIANGSLAAGEVDYVVEVTDGTDYQFESGRIAFGAANKAGTVSVNGTASNCTGGASGVSVIGTPQKIVTSGTLTVTFTLTAANPALLQLNANSSLTPSTGYPRVTMVVKNLTQQAVTVS